MKPFTQTVINIILTIPSGKVMTYGQIAKLAGSPRAARQVVRILHSMSDKYKLPWHRVINSKGQVGIQDEELSLVQIMTLEREGVEFKGKNSLSLEVYQFHPDVHDDK
jgi:methylated-DNA-protein-cysteine methyltransferase-like protein